MMLPLPSVQHEAAEGLAAEIGALQIEVDDEIELLLREILRRAAEGRARAVDQDIDPAFLLADGVRERRALRTLGHVQGDGAGMSALPLDDGLGRFRSLQIDIGDDDPDPDLRQTRGDCRPQPAAAAGDHGDAPLEIEEPRGIAGGDR